MVKLRVDSRLRISNSEQLSRDDVAALKEPFEHDNPEWAKKRSMGLSVWNEPRKIVTWKSDETELSFPRGGLSHVTKILSDLGIDTEVVDAREYASPVKYEEPRTKLYDFQEEIVGKMLAREQGILRAPTGSGKTQMLLVLAARVRTPTLVLVHSQGLLDQWRERAVSVLGMRASQVGIVQGKKFNLRPFTISIQKTMANIVGNSKEVRDYFGCVIADETHLFAARTFFASVDPFPARYRFGASADHRRKDKREFLVHDLFGDVVAEVSRKELEKSGHIMEVEIRVVPTTYAAPWYGMSDDVHSELELNFVKLVQEMAADDDRNWLGYRIVREEVERGEQVLIMAHEREHCMKIGQALTGMGIRTGYLLGGLESAKEFAASVVALKDGSLRVGVGTYKAIGTGIDIPRVGVAIAMTPIAGNQQFFGQVRGRVCRVAKGKTDARLYVLWDSAVYSRHLRNLNTWNQGVVVRDPSGDWIPSKDFQRSFGF